jgi:hypothetical protein
VSKAPTTTIRNIGFRPVFTRPRLLAPTADGFFHAPAAGLGIGGRSVAGGGRKARWWATKNNAPDNGDGLEMTAAVACHSSFPGGGKGGGMAQTRKQQQQFATEDKDRAQPVGSK